MNAKQVRKARQAVANCAAAGIPFEIAALLVASWMKRQGIQVSEANLETAFQEAI